MDNDYASDHKSCTFTNEMYTDEKKEWIDFWGKGRQEMIKSNTSSDI